MLPLTLVALALGAAWWYESRQAQRLMAKTIDDQRARIASLEELLDHYRTEGLKEVPQLAYAPDISVPEIPPEVQRSLDAIEDADAREEFRQLLLFRMSADPSIDPMTALDDLFN